MEANSLPIALSTPISISSSYVCANVVIHAIEKPLFNNKFFLVHIICPNFSTMHWVCMKEGPVPWMDGQSKDRSMVLIQAEWTTSSSLKDFWLTALVAKGRSNKQVPDSDWNWWFKVPLQYIKSELMKNILPSYLSISGKHKVLISDVTFIHILWPLFSVAEVLQAG